MTILPLLKNLARKFLPGTLRSSSPDHPLCKEDWAEFYHPDKANYYIKLLKSGNLSAHTREIAALVKPGETVLEIGSGSGESSVYLAMQGARPTAFDFNAGSLELARLIAKACNVSIETVQADVENTLPFPDNHFDCVWQAGLLEHFEREKRIELCRAWGRVTKKTMISMIPNAASIAYRTGKALMEKEGRWPYGLELPQYSLADEFAAAGFRITKEYTIGADHALNFLPQSHYLRKALKRWLKENQAGDNCGQGYLLVTVGEKI